MRKSDTPQYNLPRFKKALEAFAEKLPPVTHWRYRNGILPPPFGQMLVENPELALALAIDAADLAKQRIAAGAKKAGRKRVKAPPTTAQPDEGAASVVVL